MAGEGGREVKELQGTGPEPMPGGRQLRQVLGDRFTPHLNLVQDY